MPAAPIQSLNRGKQIRWKRFWCLLGSPINCGDDGRGFLTDPEGEYSKGLNPNLHEIEHLIPEVGPLILCGDPGIGKTNEFQRLKALFQENKGSKVLALTFRLHISNIQDFRQRTVESAIWQAWKDSDEVFTLMIDGIDEGLIRIPTFVSALRGLLEEEPTERLRLILTCRSAEWPENQGSGLLDLWQRHEDAPRQVYELCPLRYKDVQLAAKAWNIDADKFGDAIWQAQATGLATRPVTLFLLRDEFLKNGKLPSSHRELYRRGAIELVGEVDQERLEICRAARTSENGSTIEERFDAAQRLAAFLLCCGKNAIRRGERADDLADEHALQITQVLESRTSPSLAAGLEAVESALFTSVGQERFGFAHQTFAECLGAMQLAELPFSQVRRLLMQRDEAGEHVVPQLIELAAWAAGSHTQFCQHLIQVDPTALLHCDASVLSDGMKRQLVESILSGAKTGRVLDDYRLYRFFHTLKHADIAGQLKHYITDKTADRDSRSIAIEIAERCQLSEVTDELFAIVKEETGLLRECAAEALCEVISTCRLTEIEPLARGEIGEDPKLSIRGYALKRLVPTHWDILVALPYTQAKADTRFYGSYYRFLDFELPKHLKAENLPSVLEWLQNNLGVFDSRNSYKKFAQRALDLSFQELDSPAISEPFIQLWIKLAIQHFIHNLAITFGLKKKFAEDTVLRRKLVSMLMNATLPNELNIWSLFYELNVVATPNDFEWLIDQAYLAASESQKAWSTLIEMHMHNPQLRVPCWDKLVQALEEIHALRKRLEWLRAWELDEPIARQSKARHLRDNRRQKAFRKLLDKENVDPRPIRENALRNGRVNAAQAWYPLWHILHWGDDSQEGTSLSCIDVEAFGGWGLLSFDEKELARVCAREFLLHYPEDTSSWVVGSNASLCSTTAIRLLQDDLLNDHELMQAVSSRWIRLFAGFHFNEDHGAEELFVLLDRIDHHGALAAMMVDIEGDRPQICRPYAMRVAKKCWDHRYDHAMEKYVDSLTNPKSIYETVDEWRDVSVLAAANYTLQRLPLAISEAKDTYPIQLKVSICSALLSQPVEAFRMAGDLLNKDHVLAEKIWSHVFHDIDTREDSWWRAWNEGEMAELYVHLMEVLPRSGDPNHDFGFVAQRTSAAWSRDRILNRIAERSTRAACKALSGLIHELPDQARSLRWYYRQALIQCRRNEWCPPVVAEVQKLFKNASSRLINSEQDLQEAVLESLERYQRRLTNNTLPAIGEIWNQEPDHNGRKHRLRPKDEKSLQQSVARWLRDDLECTRGIIANCEVEPRLGSYTDIWVDALRQGKQKEFEKMTVVIEVKGCWHKDVRSAMHTQLVEGYLRPNALIAGIYLVGWFVCDAYPDAGNRTGVKTIEEAKDWLSKEVACYDGKTKCEFVSSIVLDCRWPQTSPSKTRV